MTVVEKVVLSVTVRLGFLTEERVGQVGSIVKVGYVVGFPHY